MFGTQTQAAAAAVYVTRQQQYYARVAPLQATETLGYDSEAWQTLYGFALAFVVLAIVVGILVAFSCVDSSRHAAEFAFESAGHPRVGRNCELRLTPCDLYRGCGAGRGCGGGRCGGGGGGVPQQLALQSGCATCPRDGRGASCNSCAGGPAAVFDARGYDAGVQGAGSRYDGNDGGGDGGAGGAAVNPGSDNQMYFGRADPVRYSGRPQSEFGTGSMSHTRLPPFTSTGASLTRRRTGRH